MKIREGHMPCLSKTGRLKKGFPSRAKAKAFHKKLVNTYPDVQDQKPYHCKACGSWHLTVRVLKVIEMGTLTQTRPEYTEDEKWKQGFVTADHVEWKEK